MRVLLKSFLAGMLIGLGCVVYLMCSDKIVGSFLFSFGLFTIVNMKLDLFTGKIGYLATNFNLPYVRDLLITLVGNFLGTLFSAVMIHFTRLNVSELLTTIVDTKLGDNYLSMFILAIFCGMLMFLGVDLFKNIESYLGKALAVIFAVMIFILSGFEHCIADMFYFNLAFRYNLITILVVILGNSVGGILLCWLFELAKKEKVKAHT